MSTHVTVIADQVYARGFSDAAPHRADLPTVYQRYMRLGTATEDARAEDHQALWRPLFMTSFGAADFLADRSVFGAERIVVSSASSKTAMGIAFLVTRGVDAIRIVGLTSRRNVAFTKRTGYYDRVIAYDELHELSARAPLLFVDLAGDDRLLSELRRLAGDRLHGTVMVGATHWEQRRVDTRLGEGEAELFFLPSLDGETPQRMGQRRVHAALRRVLGSVSAHGREVDADPTSQRTRRHRSRLSPHARRRRRPCRRPDALAARLAACDLFDAPLVGARRALLAVERRQMGGVRQPPLSAWCGGPTPVGLRHPPSSSRAEAMHLPSILATISNSIQRVVRSTCPELGAGQ